MNRLHDQFFVLFLSGIFLLSTNVLGICIASINVHNDVDLMLHGVLFIPNTLSYVLIIVGALGYLDVLSNIKNVFKTKRNAL